MLPNHQLEQVMSAIASTRHFRWVEARIKREEQLAAQREAAERQQREAGEVARYSQALVREAVAIRTREVNRAVSRGKPAPQAAPWRELIDVAHEHLRDQLARGEDI